MKTRVVDSNKGPDIDFDMSSLPAPQPVREEDTKKPSIADVAKMLAAPQPAAANNKIVEVESSDRHVVEQARASTNLGPEWVRQDMPSHSVPYSFNTDIFLRPLSLDALSLIYAAQANESFTLFVDALNHCINVDIRDLTPEDLKTVMYWVRDNSYPRSPLEVEYVTRYNNTVKVSTRRSNLSIRELDMTRNEAAEWRAKGIIFPTVRDAELIHNSENLPDAEKWKLEYAQYVEYIPTPGVTDYSDYVDRKLARLNELTVEHGLEFIGWIDKFKALLDYGMIERVKIKDPQFEPQAAISFFMQSAKDYQRAIQALPAEAIEDQIPAVLAMAQRAQALVREAVEMSEKLERGEPVVAKEEVVVVNITMADFFPPV